MPDFWALTSSDLVENTSPVSNSAQPGPGELVGRGLSQGEVAVGVSFALVAGLMEVSWQATEPSRRLSLKPLKRRASKHSDCTEQHPLYGSFMQTWFCRGCRGLFLPPWWDSETSPRAGNNPLKTPLGGLHNLHLLQQDDSPRPSALWWTTSSRSSHGPSQRLCGIPHPGSEGWRPTQVVNC